MSGGFERYLGKIELMWEKDRPVEFEEAEKVLFWDVEVGNHWFVDDGGYIDIERPEERYYHYPRALVEELQKLQELGVRGHVITVNSRLDEVSRYELDDEGIKEYAGVITFPDIPLKEIRVEKKLAVVLVSGGMDSCVTAAMANEKYRMAFLHLNYGQRTEKRELKAFHDIADFYEVPEGMRLVVSIDHLWKIGGSSLTDDSIPISRANLDSDSIPTSYVPFRNAHILAIATSWAEVIGASAIFIGAVEEDSSGYPDCRKDFYEAFNRVIEIGTKPDTHIEIFAPVIKMSKKTIVLKGRELRAPLHLTWSCYQNDGDIACGVCDSCALRLKGFREAGWSDPIKYENDKAGPLHGNLPRS